MDVVGKKTLEVMGNAGWYNDYITDSISGFLGGDILEVGFGIGNFTEKLTSFGKVTAIEYDKFYLRNFKNRNKSVSYGFGDIEKGKYFFKQKHFSAIVCFNVLEHINNDEGALKNMYKLLRNNGRLILLVPAHQMLFSKLDKLLGHFRRYDKTTLKAKLVRAGFNIEDLRYFNWAGAIGWLLFVRLMKRDVMPSGEVGIFNSLGKYLLFPEKIFSMPFGLSVLSIARKGSL